ncbi:DUF4232 domain-containing protein [Streptomyces beigongshangae]|uniref:DUF4232 domain-containing protein n=1 Tax=Streptomyces beigongshangae TaxID=2841597 RepID=UPI001C85E303|nr:DUF4232 domain-containing protein [Streptomyces sp. REN17]
MSARTTRTRLLAAAALTVATLSLTACSNADGVRDEGAPAGSSSVAPSSQENEGTGTGTGRADAVAARADKTGKTGKGSSGATGAATGSDAKDSSALTPCTDIRVTATPVPRPLNHLLLTVTNTGSTLCHLPNYPVVRFGEAQSVPPVVEESKPQAVVTLAPGESGYAGVGLSAADGSGSNGYTAESLEVHLDTDSDTPFSPSLPAEGVYVDDSIYVTYWQASRADALTW